MCTPVNMNEARVRSSSGVPSKVRTQPSSSIPIAVGVEIRDNPKVPDIEQIIAAGGAVQNLLNAAHALGYGAILLSGPATEHPRVKASLGLKERDYFLGTVFLGTAKASPQQEAVDTAGTVFEWKAPA